MQCECTFSRLTPDRMKTLIFTSSSFQDEQILHAMWIAFQANGSFILSRDVDGETLNFIVSFKDAPQGPLP